MGPADMSQALYGLHPPTKRDQVRYLSWVQGCVKTCESRERAEIYSQLPSPGTNRHLEDIAVCRLKNILGGCQCAVRVIRAILTVRRSLPVYPDNFTAVQSRRRLHTDFRSALEMLKHPQDDGTDQKDCGAQIERRTGAAGPCRVCAAERRSQNQSNIRDGKEYAHTNRSCVRLQYTRRQTQNRTSRQAAQHPKRNNGCNDRVSSCRNHHQHCRYKEA